MAKLLLRSNEDIRLAIRRRANEIAEKMTDQEFFLSEQFKAYATRLLDFLLRKHKLYSLEILFDNSPNSLTACTDGKDITANAGNILAQTPKYLEARFKVVMGLMFHEAAHKLFMDFTFFHKAMGKIASGSLVGKFDTLHDPEMEKAKEELDKIMASNYAGAMAQLYSELHNIVVDGHDEAAMRRLFPGFITDCIDTMDKVQWDTTPTIEKLIEKRQSDFGILSQLILEYALWHEYKYDTKTPDVQKYLDVMVEIEPYLDVTASKDSAKDQWNAMNQIILVLWPYIRQMFPENPPSAQNQSGNGQQGSSSGSQGNQGQSGGQGSGSGQNQSQPSNQAPSPEQVKQALQQLAQAIRESMGVNPAPVNGSGKPVSAQSVVSGSMAPGASADAASIAVSIAEEPATMQIQQELDAAQMDAIRNMNLPLIHEQIPVQIHRHFTTKEVTYKRILSDIAPVLRNLVSEMKALLKELNEESVQRHRRFGPIMEATESYRLDGSFFAKKKMPEDLPNMAISVLIDQSGSMSGRKIEYAKRTAILLEQFAHQMQIPVMIAGHSTEGSNVVFNIFTDFLSAMTEKDRYALAGIDTIGSNRDGLPIRMCCDMLAARPERVKLMIVLSDGAPAHRGYSGKEAMKDISDTVKEYRRKGVLVYGAALEMDKEVIEKIYGKAFLSFEDITKLPKRLVSLVRQQIV